MVRVAKSPKGLSVLKLRSIAAILLATAALAGCERNPLLVKRSVCPAVGIPNFTGDVTLFDPPASRDAKAIDMVATITDLRGVCAEGATSIGTNVSFTVVARRTSAAGPRTVTLPFFATVVQGGNTLVSKQVGSVTLNFAAGQQRTTAAGAAHADIARSAATLKADIQNKIGRKRKAGDLDAATDPLADPEVKAAVRAVTFEVLVGFQLDEAALGYNVLK